MSTTASTTSGRVRGLKQASSIAFRSIPFAAPPVGDLRYRPPQPAGPWTDVRDALTSGTIAPQVTNEYLEDLFGGPPEPQAEDCLYLHVFTPAVDEGRRPVLVWIHGGGFTLGSGSEPMYDGTALAERGDVVVVTINYRLGALGFLCLPESAGKPFTNFGMLDQVAALEWVRREIASFGGDPGNVTIFGESAGGMCVGALLGSPRAEGLFHKAILQSGACHNALTVAEARENAGRFASLAGVSADDVDALRSLSVEKILELQGQLEAEGMQKHVTGEPPDSIFQPVADGHFLDGLPIDAVRAGRSRDVALLIGTTRDEEKLSTLVVPGLERTDDFLVRAFSQRLAVDDGEAKRLVETYRQARAERGEPVTNDEVYAAVGTDYIFRIPADRLASVHAQYPAPTYAYRFDWCSPMMDGALGAAHGIDLPFVFGSYTNPRIAPFAGSGPAAERVAAQTMDAWIAFARSGDPSTPDLAWTPYDEASRTTMLIDETCRSVEAPREPERACWEGRR